jgi:TRAP-type C4-dicarboxylate transport system permease small subunit
VRLPIGWVSLGVVRKLHAFDQRSDALDLPVWIPQMTIPFALLGIPVVMVIVLLCRGAEDRKPH